jgi:dynein heavy chain
VSFALIWALGGILEEDARPKFQEFFLDLIAGEDICSKYNVDLTYAFTPAPYLTKITESPNVFDLCFDRQKLIWLNWMQTVPVYKPPLDKQFQNLVIPTIDSVRNSHFLHLFLDLKTHLLLTGPTGTGKTVNIVNELNQFFFNEKYDSSLIHLIEI